MYSGYRKIFWGIFIITFNINLGIIKILPAFIGFMIISSGINSLYNETNIESFNKARVLANIISAITFIGQFIELSLMKSFILNGIWVVLYTAIEIVMFYKYFEGVIEYFNINNNQDLAHKNIKSTRFFIIASIINLILINFALIFNITWLQLIVAIVMIILRIYLMVLTNNFKKMHNVLDEE